ncbi:hypothetical protein R3Q06_29015 [Rhodococcus erythropolis]|uniref:hypothetical protein n=1 Tax=Rhodococcus erythropolis TaxID=1833 RepID=UPI0029490AB8|nr:hypothetical protein [Rhodococcus erythropolis]MDV6277536.1 hypothetical protein [Rhodococcus erythropolis]
MDDAAPSSTRVEDLIQALGPLPTAWNIEELCLSLSTRRRRPLVLHPMNLPALPFGLWYDDGISDHIIYRSTVMGFHRDHVILHEICHMLARHTQIPLAAGPGGAGRASVRGAGEFAARINPYTARQEETAESFATLILEKAYRLNPAPVSAFEHRASAVFGTA